MSDSDLVKRLRTTLPVCPYDQRSPDYYTAPDDKPCVVCGGEPDGPDKCRGADTRCMAEAAARIEALAARVEAIRNATLEEAAEKCDENAVLLRNMVPKLLKNGHPAMAELQKVRAEQTEGIAAAIRALATPAIGEKDGMEKD